MENKILPTLIVNKSSYFKANAYILEPKDNIKALKVSWQESRASHTNLQVSFYLACAMLRVRYILLQAEPRYSYKNKEILQARLRTLKFDLEEEETPLIISDWK